MCSKKLLLLSLSMLNINAMAVPYPPPSESHWSAAEVATRAETTATLQYAWDSVTKSMVLGKFGCLYHPNKTEAKLTFLDPMTPLPPTTRDLIVRRADDENGLTARDTPKWFQIGIRAVDVTITYGAAAYLTWGGLRWSCRDFTESYEDVTSCVFGAIATAWLYAKKAKQLYQWFGSLKAEGRANGWSLGNLWKREMESRDLDDLSRIVGSTVHYAGEYLEPAPEGATLAEREAIMPSSVFGFTNENGIDMHFALRDGVEAGSLTIKLGLGNGFGDKNGETLRRRGFQTQSFISGGINIIAQNTDDRQMDPVNDWDHLYNMASCEFSGDNSKNWNTQGFYYQTYDLLQENTMMAGALAPFDDAKQASYIAHMVDIPTPVAYSSTKCYQIE